MNQQAVFPVEFIDVIPQHRIKLDDLPQALPAYFKQLGISTCDNGCGPWRPGESGNFTKKLPRSDGCQVVFIQDSLDILKKDSRA